MLQPAAAADAEEDSNAEDVDMNNEIEELFLEACSEAGYEIQDDSDDDNW